MTEKVLLSQPFEDHRSSFIDEAGRARRDFYMGSVGFGTIRLGRNQDDEPYVMVQFTDLGVCGVPLLRYPGLQLKDVLTDGHNLGIAVRFAAAERDEQPGIPLPEGWYQ